MSSSTTDEELATVCEDIWTNWAPDQPTGRCANCPAHWAVRPDFPNPSQSRDGAYDHGPFFGHGALTAVDVVILAWEPGTPDGSTATPHRNELTFDEFREDCIARAVDGAGTLNRIQSLVELLEGSDNPEIDYDARSIDSDELDGPYDVYFSQVKKCNELGSPSNDAANGDDNTLDGDDRGWLHARDVQNSIATHRCAGLEPGCDTGYLRRELAAANPDLVLGLGEEVFKHVAAMYGLDPLEGQFTDHIPGWTDQGAVERHTVSGDDINFEYVPVPHPNWPTSGELLADIGITVTDRPNYDAYYEWIGEQLLET